MINPFIHGRALEPHEFVERERELRQLKSLLANRAPIALVGQARVGKTSLLNYIVDSAANATDRSSRTEGFIFSLVDAQALGGTTSQAEFWEQALMPLVQSLRTDQR
jgi:AAA+ ATPase superfamily predicted ATPase